MDLSDGSDAEDGGNVSEELNEDDLLGPSDDEDVDVSNARGGRFSLPEAAASQQQKSNTRNQSVDAEEEFLDLALGDEEDGLELTPSDASNPTLSPVKLKVLPTTVVTPPDIPALGPGNLLPEESQTVPPVQIDTEDHAESEEQEHEDDLPEAKEEIYEDDDDEEKGQRSRFLSERPPADGPKSSSSYSGNPQPIRTLGDHFKFGNGNQFYGGSRMRGNMRPRGMMQNQSHMRRGFRNGGPRPTNHHQIHPFQQPPLRPEFLNNSRPEFRPPGPEIPVSQCSGQIFIDFNQPMQNQQQQQQQPQPNNQLLPPGSQPQSPLQQTRTQSPSATPAQRQGVGIVRPQQQMPPVNRPLPVQNRPVKPQLPRPNLPRAAEERRGPFFPPLQQRPRNPFVPQQQFPPQPPPPQQHLQMRPPIFLPNQQPIFIPQQHQQQHQNFLPPNPQPPPIMGNFPYVGPPGPGMMMMDFNRFQNPNQGPPPMWLEAPPPFGGPPQYPGMPPGFFPPQQHQSQPMHPFPHEQHFMQEQTMNMLGYGPPSQFQQHPRPPVVHAYEQPQPIMEIRRERDRYDDYERESGEKRRHDEYRRHASQHRSEDEDEYRRSPTKVRRYTEEPHYYEEEAKSKVSSSSTPVDPRTAELAEKTKKEMGIDDEYMAKMEEQKRKREEIMRKKGRKQDEPTSTSSSSPKKTSIFVNPAAFGGDLSLLNRQIQQEMKKSSSRAQSHHPPPKPKPKTILRVTKNSKGEVIHMEKLLKVEKAKTTAKI